MTISGMTFFYRFIECHISSSENYKILFLFKMSVSVFFLVHILSKYLNISLKNASVLNLHMGMDIEYPLAESESGSVHPLVCSFAMQNFRTRSSLLSEFYMKLDSYKCRGSVFEKKSHPVRMDHKVTEIAQKMRFWWFDKKIVPIYMKFLYLSMKLLLLGA